MKYFHSTLAALAFATATTAQTTHELTNIGNTFDPPVINMIAGDSIHLVLSNPHTCTQVDELTWLDNENTPNGGFNYPSGEFTFALNVPGTYYYVCSPHANSGMKGQFIVATDNTGVHEQVGNTPPLLTPNPANSRVVLSGFVTGRRVEVLDAAGKRVLEAVPASDGVVDVASLGTGNYSVVVRDEKGRAVATERLVITR
ncbi:MAG: T9SS type A sorting domain-containing protein [Flavobacteriales bacterium]|jgi:plastocyanin|nr:T9SS type A sorting domain-containing protein [Flavobacteriales bacterium]MCB0757849.1 T9SS type A sorting domain-containing protein [Flavobacteriales bacterium]